MLSKSIIKLTKMTIEEKKTIIKNNLTDGFRLYVVKLKPSPHFLKLLFDISKVFKDTIPENSSNISISQLRKMDDVFNQFPKNFQVKDFKAEFEKIYLTLNDCNNSCFIDSINIVYIEYMP